MATVRLNRLLKRFGNVHAVDEIDIFIEHGEFLSLLGPSGCGKTTTLRLIAGFLDPDGGQIIVGDRQLSAPGSVIPPERRNMSMIFQSYAIWPHKTVFENVAYGLQLRRVSKEDLKRRVERMLEVVKLGQLAGRYPSELSGGQQQRVALARALVIEPEILLLDEPLSNLDANLREEMRFEIRRLHEEFRITTVYVTHDQGEAMVTSDRIAVMNLGKVEQIGTPEDVYERAATTFVASFIGVSNVLEVERIDGKAVRLAGTPLQIDPTAPPALTAGPTLNIAIRPHTIAMRPATGNGHSNGTNVLKGEVRRSIYLGETRDYLVDVGSGVILRVVSAPNQRFEAGDSVELSIDPSDCRPVAQSAEVPTIAASGT